MPNRTTTVALSAESLARVEARLWGHYYVQAAMDPAYATEEGLEILVRAILRSEAQFRASMAAAAITGWTQHRAPETVPPNRLTPGTQGP